MKKSKISLGKLFYNNKFVVVISIVLSFALWIKLSTDSSEISSMTITDIPITVNLSDSAKDSGLTVFGAQDMKAQVTVTGNRLVLGQLSKKDVQVVALQAPSVINTTGTYTLELTPKKNSLLSDYAFSSNISPNFVTVMVDRYKEVNFDVKENIKYSADPNRFIEPVSLSQSSISISGPESRILEIAKVVVEGKINGTIKNTTTLSNITPTLYDASGNKLSSANMKFSVDTIDATVNVLERKKVKAVPEITGVPNGYNINSKVSVSPSQIEIAGTEDVLKPLEEVKLTAIDLSKVNPKNNKFDLNILIPTGCKNLSNSETAKLTFDMDGMGTKKIVVDKVSFLNVGEGKTASSRTSNISVEIVGPTSHLKNLTNDDVTVQVDLKDKADFVGQAEMPATVKVRDGLGCWGFGEHKVNVIVSKG